MNLVPLGNIVAALAHIGDGVERPTLLHDETNRAFGKPVAVVLHPTRSYFADGSFATAGRGRDRGIALP